MYITSNTKKIYEHNFLENMQTFKSLFMYFWMKCYDVHDYKESHIVNWKQIYILYQKASAESMDIPYLLTQSLL